MTKYIFFEKKLVKNLELSIILHTFASVRLKGGFRGDRAQKGCIGL